jgi:xyloglucan-specific exo-beta-1,4-glucanase
MNRRLSSFIFKFALAALGSLACCAQVKSQPYTWKNVTVGGGGFIPGIVFSRVEKGLAYIRSDMGGFYRWDAGQQSWLPLNDAMAESSYQGGESIAPDPVDPNVVYAAAGMYRSDPAAMLRSRDRGRTWDVLPVNFKMGGNEDGRGMGERLAVDPNSTNILLFGSRHDGLQRSDNYAQTWSAVSSFPVKGRGGEVGEPTHGSSNTHGGLSCVVFDPHSGSRVGQRGVDPTKTIFVGSTDPGSDHLYRSDDAGANWTAVGGDGAPAADLLPLQAQIDDRGLLYITYSDRIGPNNAKRGAVFVFDTASTKWTDITPIAANGRGMCGYCGLSLDRQHPGTLAVTTLDRWNLGDTVFRSTDGGTTWNDIQGKSDRDVSATPFLFWGKPQPRLGWWMTALAIDPFDSDHAVYATGATVFATHNFSDLNRNQPTHWATWVTGIEQTAIITLCSPPAGPPLLSGIGDISGFVHEKLDRSPPQGMYQPDIGSVQMIAFADHAPNVLVRSGAGGDDGAKVALSDDSGKSWRVLAPPSPVDAPDPSRHRDAPAIAVSADGRTIIITADAAVLTTDRDGRELGDSWKPVIGLPEGDRPVADRMDARQFYSIDFGTGQLFRSDDGGLHFAPLACAGLPDNIRDDRPGWSGSSWPLQAPPGKAGELWYFGRAGLFHSVDGGKSFGMVASDVHVEALSFGKPPAGSDEPALFAIGSVGKLKAIWRSDDSGQNWIRLNDDQHEWGRRFRCLCGDPRVFGRVYVGTDGRAILYGDIMKNN